MFNIFNLSLRLNGFPIKKALVDYKNIQAISSEKYEEYVMTQRSAIVAYHLKENHLYKELIGNKKIDQWEELPIMTKKDFQKPLEQRISKTFSLKNIYINKTSGSSGDPFIFAKDKYCHALTWANIFHKFGQFEINFNTSLQARFYGIPLDFYGNTKERIKDFFSNRYRFPIFDLSDTFLEKVTQHFSNKKFDYINGYTSSIVVFAKFLEQKQLVLKTICPSLKCCVVTSEMLFEEDKKLLEKQLGVPVVNEYGASELDLIAFQNPFEEWQVNSETLYVEIVDDNDNVLPYGKEGRIVITSLYNKANPFIRYDIGDIGILDQTSSFKKPILKKLIGRTNDIALLPSGKKSPGLTFYYITKSIIEDDGNVKEFIIKQTKIDTFDIEYVSQTELSTVQIDKIKKSSTTYLEEGLYFSFTRKEKLERSKSGKLKQFVSLVS